MKKTKKPPVIACAAVCAALSIVLRKIRRSLDRQHDPHKLREPADYLLFGRVRSRRRRACGAVADLLGCLLRGYDINPLITLAAAAMGIVPGTLTKYVFRSRTALPVATSALASHAVCSVVLKSSCSAHRVCGSAQSALRPTGTTYAAIAPIEAYLYAPIMKNGAVKKELAANDREKDMHHGKIRDRKAIGEKNDLRRGC